MYKSYDYSDYDQNEGYLEKEEIIFSFSSFQLLFQLFYFVFSTHITPQLLSGRLTNVSYIIIDGLCKGECSVLIRKYFLA